MTDKELLELAAKAAGYAICLDGDRQPYIKGVYWNPLTDDGDALRLAVKLNIDLLFDNDPDGPIVYTDVSWEPSIPFMIEVLGKDPYAATRRAIVRVAAEIGRTMK